MVFMRWKKGKQLLALVLAGILSFSSLTVYAQQDPVPIDMEQPSEQKEVPLEEKIESEMDEGTDEQILQTPEELPVESSEISQELEKEEVETSKVLEEAVYGIDGVKETEEAQKILKQIGVGFAEISEMSDRMATMAMPSPGQTVYTTVIRSDIGVIDQVMYKSPTEWEFIDSWREGLLGSGSGEPLFCVDPTMQFTSGNKVTEDASRTYNKQTIQTIVALQYYIDHHLCSHLTEDYRYLLKQVAVWMVLDTVHHWFPAKVVLETGNNVKCSCGTWVSAHNGVLRNDGFQWALKHYQEFEDAWGLLYKGNGQPLSKWGGTRTVKGTLEIVKHSGNREVTNENANYSLAGAVYGVYTKDNRSTPKYKVTMTEHADGWSPSGVPVGTKYGYGQLKDIPAGEYFIKELTPPPGFAKDDRWYPSDNTPIKVGGVVPVRQVVTDQPQMDQIQLLLGKVDKETNTNRPQGSGTLRDAEFTVKYYKYLGDPDVDPAKLGKKAERTWVLKTDENGTCQYDNAYLVSGDKLYTTSSGKPALPLGTVTIQETKSPEGYLMNSQIFVRQIKSNGTSEDVNTYHYPTVPEQVLQLELVKKQEKTEIPIPGAAFEHVKPDGSKSIIITNEKGMLVIKGLQYGKHQLREIKAPDGFQVNKNVIEFTVQNNNQVLFDSKVDELLGKVQFQITQEGQIQVSVEDRLSPFALQIVKENNKGMKLERAEFTLYEDKDCQKVVQKATSNHQGELGFKNLEVGKKYYLVETKAPKGYRKPVDVFGNPKVYEVYTESTPSKDEFIFYVNGKPYQGTSDGMFTVTGTKADRVANMKIINQIGMLLPETGSKDMIPLLVLGSTLILIAMKKKTKEKKEYEK